MILWIAKPGLDLDVLIKKMDEDSKIVAANAANIVRLFYSRGKTAVQEKLPVRPLQAMTGYRFSVSRRGSL